MAGHKSNGRERLQSVFRKGVKEGRRLERADRRAAASSLTEIVAKLRDDMIASPLNDVTVIDRGQLDAIEAVVFFERAGSPIKSIGGDHG
ncbi:MULTISPECIES: hypothetical protein [unclassified Shinella]|uniref:hypothetical protein n=1 Tax=unclassified Shinella TaxID=2643062 RepID=UPI00234F5B00|nr:MULTISPECIES: hypothetical protein [unclassified Shinella]MCO5153350.1 hypothetical protein [Shinella sp.]MDC7260529.1 hypothetical protein [Shinella sp. HY16]MDC7267424.1 hypothetical protein [Shinella sp. YZ44]